MISPPVPPTGPSATVSQSRMPLQAPYWCSIVVAINREQNGLYFVELSTGATQWSHPLDDHFQRLAQKLVGGQDQQPTLAAFAPAPSPVLQAGHRPRSPWGNSGVGPPLTKSHGDPDAAAAAAAVAAAYTRPGSWESQRSPRQPQSTSMPLREVAGQWQVCEAAANLNSAVL